MAHEQLNILKDNTYYDQTGKQILVGDLLKVIHFYSGRNGKKVNYMYHVVVMEETKDFPVMAVSAHWTTKPHCRMYSCANKQTRIYEKARIISELDFETKRKRIKIDKSIK